MFPSDNRETVVRTADGQRMQYGHGHALYDELLRIPLLIRPPGGLGENRIVETLFSQIDLAETLAEIVHLPPRSTHGISLALPLSPNPPAGTRTEEKDDELEPVTGARLVPCSCFDRRRLQQ